MRAALAILLLAAPVYADEPHREGQYSGVTPGDGQPGEPAGKPARPKRPPAKGTLTWIGFSARDGGAEVFFQSVAPFELSQRVEGGTLIVHLGLTRLGHNTWRQVDTRFFDNPLSGIVARAVGAARATKHRPAHAAGIDVRIAFKNAREAREGTLRTTTEADGRFYAYLAFPEGAAAAPSAQPPAPSAQPPAVSEPDDEPPPPTRPKS